MRAKESKERVKERSRIWREANKEYVKKKQREYRATHREQLAANQKVWREANQDRFRATLKAYRAKNSARRKEYFKSWHAANPDKRKKYYQGTHYRLKTTTMNAYGGRCACCFEDRLEFLTIDHINGDGAQHRKEVKGSQQVYRYLVKHNFPADYRVLCFNCNCAIGLFGYCPHERGVAS